MSFLFQAHSGFRYVVLLLGVVCALNALYGVVTKKPVGRPTMALASAFAGALDLQILLGIVVLFTRASSTMAIGPHLITMIFAAVCAHIVPSVMRRRPPEARTHVPYLVGSLIALGLIAVGIMALGRPSWAERREKSLSHGVFRGLQRFYAIRSRPVRFRLHPRGLSR